MQRSCDGNVLEVLRTDKVARATVAGAMGTVRQQERQSTEGILQRTVAFTEREMGVPVGFAEVGFQGQPQASCIENRIQSVRLGQRGHRTLCCAGRN